MGTSEQYHYYDRNALKALIIGCVIGSLILIVPAIVSAGFNGTTPESSPSFAYGLLEGVSGFGILILFTELVFVMVSDWRGVITLRGAVKTQRWKKGKLVSTIYWYVLLCLFFPYIMLPIYLTRTVRDQRQAEQRKTVRVEASCC